MRYWEGFYMNRDMLIINMNRDMLIIYNLLV